MHEVANIPVFACQLAVDKLVERRLTTKSCSASRNSQAWPLGLRFAIVVVTKQHGPLHA